jgi:lipopolysaccharide biosynthesis glycosyltransferase
MIEKQEFINDQLLSTPDPTIVFCDVDIAFYGDVHDDLQECLGDNDMAFLKDHNTDIHGRNGGFIVVRNGEKIQKLFGTVLSKLKELSKTEGKPTKFNTSEQHTINSTLDSMPEISWTYLPSRYYTHGLYIDGVKEWDEESQRGLWWESKDDEEKEAVFIPEDIKVHHANWASGVPRKLDLLKFIRNKIKERSDGQ